MRYPLRNIAVALVAVAVVLAQAGSAWALGTPANTQVDNRASVTYSVLTVPQTLIESSPAGNSNPGGGNGAVTRFVVDDRVDLVVTLVDVANVPVIPGGSGFVATFLVANTGNATHDFRLNASNGGVAPFAPPPDNFDATAFSVFAEDDTTPGSYQALEDTDFWVEALAAGDTVLVYVLATIPLGQVNNDVAAVTLRATAANSVGPGLGLDTAETAGPDTPLAVDVVWGDPDSDLDTFPEGWEETVGAYMVVTAGLTVAKTSSVISDPFNGVSPNAKAIPGAIVEYTVRIDNAGPATATSVTISDDLGLEIVSGSVSFVLADYGPLSGMRVAINGGAFTVLTNVAGDDDGEWNDSSANTVIVNNITLNTGDFAEVQYRVTVTYP